MSSNRPILADSSIVPKKKRVLLYEHVSGGGMAGLPVPASLFDEGRAMLRAVVEAFHEAGFEVVTTRDQRLVDHLPADEIITIDRPGELHNLLSRLMTETDRGLLIAPETDGVLLDLTLLADRIPGWSLGSTATAVAVCSDKLKTAEHLEGQGIAHPETWRLDRQKPNAKPKSKFVMKPIDGAGCCETYLSQGYPQDSWTDGSLGAPRRQIVQEFVTGTSLGLSALCDGHGAVELIGVCRHDVRFESESDGYPLRIESHAGHPADDIAPERLTNAIAVLKSIEGLRGWVGVDVILDETTGLDTVIEINPRLTSSFVWLGNRTNSSEIVRRWLAMCG